MAYSEKVIDHYENPRNVGSFDNNDENVGSGMVGAPACGDVMKLQIKSTMKVSLKTRVLKLTAAVLLSLPAPGHRMGEREVSRRSAGDQKHRYC